MKLVKEHRAKPMEFSTLTPLWVGLEEKYVRLSCFPRKDRGREKRKENDGRKDEKTIRRKAQ